ncbi:unnamed protein product, partial [Gulo gulo]
GGQSALAAGRDPGPGVLRQGSGVRGPVDEPVRGAGQGQGGLWLPRDQLRAVHQSGLLLRLQHPRGPLVLQASAGHRMPIL